jgi:hypothetical protein
VEQVIGDLNGLLSVTLDAFHQLYSDLLEFAGVLSVLGVVDKHYIIMHGKKHVQE